MTRFFLLLIWCLLLSAVSAHAVERAPLVDRRQPIEITAQQLEILRLQQKSIFTGEVVAQQGEMTLKADRLVVFFLADESGIERLEATGNVVFSQLERKATADRAVYRQDDETLQLFGNAEVTQGQNRIAGDEVIFYVRENRSLVKSSDRQRVKAVFTPEATKDSE